MDHWMIRIIDVNPDTLRGENAYVVRVYGGQETCWDLGVRTWHTWMRQNPGKLSRLTLTTASVSDVIG